MSTVTTPPQSPTMGAGPGATAALRRRPRARRPGLASRLAALLATAVALACGPARAPAFTPPERGGAPWIELRSRHFVVRSDMAPADARAVITGYEQVHAALEDLVFPGVEVPAIPMSVLALRRRHEMTEIGADALSAVFIRRYYNDDDRLPALIVKGDLDAPTRMLLQHELTHRFLYHHMPGAPAWFNEGLAIYTSTMIFERKGVMLGRSLPQLLFRNEHSWDATGPRWRAVVSAPVAALPTVAELLASGPGDFRLRSHDPMFREADARRVFAYHAGAWSLVHVLMHHSEATWIAVHRYMSAMARGDAPEQAWREGAADLSMAQLEAAYQAFLRRSSTDFHRFPDYRPRAAPIEVEAAMTPTDVHLLWAAILPWHDERTIERARREIAAASALTPRDPEVLLWRARLARTDGRLDLAEQLLRVALGAHPDDERLLLELFHVGTALVMRQPPASRDFSYVDALVPVLQRVARSAETLHALATHLVARGRDDEALPLAEGAVVLDFACFSCLDTLASLYFRAGLHERALRTQLRALNVLPDGARDDEVLAHLELYRSTAPQ